MEDADDGLVQARYAAAKIEEGQLRKKLEE